jgi:hypothetical protein
VRAFDDELLQNRHFAFRDDGGLAAINADDEDMRGARPGLRVKRKKTPDHRGKSAAQK